MPAGPASRRCSRGDIHRRDTENSEIKNVVPAKAGTHRSGVHAADKWIPACAGTTGCSSLCLCGEKTYFTDEKLVGARNELITLATIGPLASVPARAECHSGSAWKAFHFFSRSASESHFSR